MSYELSPTIMPATTCNGVDLWPAYDTAVGGTCERAAAIWCKVVLGSEFGRSVLHSTTQLKGCLGPGCSGTVT
jgi:hypothetical protein